MMAQMTEGMAISILAANQRGEHYPLTIWEETQLARAFLQTGMEKNLPTDADFPVRLIGYMHPDRLKNLHLNEEQSSTEVWHPDWKSKMTSVPVYVIKADWDKIVLGRS